MRGSSAISEMPDTARSRMMRRHELAKWREPEQTWDMLQFALRLGRRRASGHHDAAADPAAEGADGRRGDGDHPRATPTTRTIWRRRSSPRWSGAMPARARPPGIGRRDHRGRAGRAVAARLDRASRVTRAPELRRIVVAVDPPVTATATSDACGIVVAGSARTGAATCSPIAPCRGASRTCGRGRRSRPITISRPTASWPRPTRAATWWERSCRRSTPTCRCAKVKATRGKWVRAEPVAALYAEGRVAHVGGSGARGADVSLCGADGRRGRSPDRLDALVWALTDLMLDAAGAAGMRVL